MIKHIVFWKITEGIDKAKTIAEIIKRLTALKGQIPGLIHIEAGADINGSPVAFDVALYSEFDSEEALAVYQDHPLHLGVKQYIGSVTSDRCVVDYSV